MAAIFFGFESHRAYVGRGGKKNEKREAEERNRTETIFTSGFGTVSAQISQRSWSIPCQID